MGLKAKPKAKVAVKAKVGAKKRRLQKPTKPAPAADPKKPATDPKKPAADPKKPEDKKSEEKKPQNGAIGVTFAYAPTGLDLNEYAKDVTVPDKLSRGADQSNPLSSNLLKLAFMTFAILLTMF